MSLVTLAFAFGACDEGATASCDPSHPSECLDPAALDYDCAERSGDGPEYVRGPVDVEWDVDAPDPFDLDRDGDRTACGE